MKLRPALCFAAALATVVCLGVLAQESHIAPDMAKPGKIEPFDLGNVQLLPGPFHEAQERNRRYLYAADIDRLLHMFRVTAGLPSSAEPLGEWESPTIEVRGHTLGHYLTACALGYASTGDDELRNRADDIVKELVKCQEALGSGYLSAFPESFFDRLESGEKVWAPWYTIHKIMAGLLDVYRNCGNRQALEVLEGMASWVEARTERLTRDQMQQTLDTEFGGMNELFYRLYSLTHEPMHLELARRFNHDKVFVPLSHHRDELEGLHANTTIPKVIGFAREYELTGSPSFRRATEFFWNQVVRARTYATGGTSNYEHWRTPPYELANELSVTSHETCCTYNMLKLTRHLFSWTGDPKYADYYERALFNGILSTQSPSDGTLMYFVPLNSGMWKMFLKPWHSFLCCNGTGIESFGKLNDSIYFHDDEGLYVNLFVASELNWPKMGFGLKQETRFPDEELTNLTVKTQRPTELSLHIRIPHWIQDGGTVELNGEPLETFSSPGSYFTIRRTWQDGDQLRIGLPMRLYLEPLPDDERRSAILYGPLVLAGRLGTTGMTDSMIEGYKEPETNLMWLREVKSLFHGPAVEAPVLVVEDDDPQLWLKRVTREAVAFETDGVGRPNDVELVPFHRLFGERYAVYWEILDIDDWQRRQIALQVPEGAVDHIQFGNALSERTHNFQAFEFERGPKGAEWVQSPFWLQVDSRCLDRR